MYCSGFSCSCSCNFRFAWLFLMLLLIKYASSAPTAPLAPSTFETIDPPLGYPPVNSVISSILISSNSSARSSSESLNLTALLDSSGASSISSALPASGTYPCRSSPSPSTSSITVIELVNSFRINDSSHSFNNSSSTSTSLYTGLSLFKPKRACRTTSLRTSRYGFKFIYLGWSFPTHITFIVSVRDFSFGGRTLYMVDTSAKRPVSAQSVRRKRLRNNRLNRLSQHLPSEN